jgi:protein disulfide-isomerase A4
MVLRVVLGLVLAAVALSPVRSEGAADVVDGEGGSAVDVTEEPAAPAESEDDGSDVVVLTDDNFDSMVTADSIWLVEFYAPWCGHCKTLAPEYEKAATALKGKSGDKVKLGKVDATTHEKTAGRFDVSGYPTLTFFTGGSSAKSYPYEGARDEAGIVQFMSEVQDGTWKPPVDRVVVLTDDNFHAFVDKEAITLVEFYAPWCGHCKKLAPDYEKAAGKLWKRGIKIAKVDSTENTKVSSEFDVSGYPTLKLFRKGTAEDYEGERTADAITDEMIDQSTDAAKPLESIFETELLTEGDDHVIIGWFNSEDDEAYTLYQQAANKLRKRFQFLYTTSEAVIANYGNVKTGTVTAFYPKFYVSKHDAATATFMLAGATAETFQQWVEETKHPLVGLRNTGAKFSGASTFDKRPLLLAFADLPTDPDFRAESKVTFEQIADVAKAYANEVTFAHVNPHVSNQGKQEAIAKEMKDYGIGDQDQDVKAVFLGSKSEDKYVMEDDGDLSDFVEAALAGSLKKYIKSAPLPKKDDGSVKIVVGKNFDKIVNDPANDVLLEFYAPWCGHCKSLAPKYKKLAKKLKSVTGITIAKIDATANDYPSHFSVEGFPTTYFVTKDNKSEPIKCEAREVNDFLTFLDKNSNVVNAASAEGKIKIPKKKKKKARKAAEPEPAVEDEEPISKDEL